MPRDQTSKMTVFTINYNLNTLFVLLPDYSQCKRRLNLNGLKCTVQFFRVQGVVIGQEYWGTCAELTEKYIMVFISNNLLAFFSRFVYVSSSISSFFIICFIFALINNFSDDQTVCNAKFTWCRCTKSNICKSNHMKEMRSFQQFFLSSAGLNFIM